MGIKERLRLARERRAEKRKEQKAFKSIVEKRTLQAKRESYEKEALEVARERGKTLARKPSIGEQIRLKLRSRRPISRRIPLQRRRTRRMPLQRRRSSYRQTPVRRRASPKRTYQRRPTQPSQQTYQPFDVGSMF